MSLALDLRPAVKRRLGALPEPESSRLWQDLQRVPAAFGRPHLHAGLGIRPLRPGLWEFRSGLHWRCLFRREGDWLVVVLLGTHGDVQRYLRNVR